MLKAKLRSLKLSVCCALSCIAQFNNTPIVLVSAVCPGALLIKVYRCRGTGLRCRW